MLIEAFAFCVGAQPGPHYVLADTPIPGSRAVWLDVSDPEHPAALCPCGVDTDPPVRLIRHVEIQRARALQRALDQMEIEGETNRAPARRPAQGGDDTPGAGEAPCS